MGLLRPGPRGSKGLRHQIVQWCAEGTEYPRMAMRTTSVLNLNVSTLSNLDSPLRQAFYKVFKTFDKVTIDYCMYYTNVLLPRYEFMYRKFEFLIKNRSSVNSLVLFWCKFRGVHELELLCRQLNANSEDYFYVIRDRFFELFERSFDAT